MREQSAGTAPEQMTPGMEMPIGILFALMKYTMSEDDFYARLFSAPQLDAALFAEGEVSDRKRTALARRKKVPIDLTDLAFYDCDLRGRFFKAFDRESRIVTLTLVDCKLNATDNLEDFTGLTTLCLVRTGENLDWSVLAGLPALTTVTVDESTEPAIRGALNGNAVNITLITEQEHNSG